MQDKRILQIITPVVAIAFAALLFTYLPQQGLPSVRMGQVQGISESAAYLPADYINTGAPNDVLVLPDGNIWYIDQFNGRLVKITQDGQILRTVGRYGTDEGEFMGSLQGITRDNDGNIYVQTTDRTYKLDFNGGFMQVWGIASGNPTDFSRADGIHYDAFSDALYIANYGHHNILKYSTTGELLSSFGEYGTGNGQFNEPVGVTTDNSGNIYVADQSNSRIQVFHPNGTFSFTFGSAGYGDGQFVALKRVVIKPNGHILATSQNSQKVEEFSSNGDWISSWGENGTNAWQFLAPRGLALDTDGNIYITDVYLRSIQKFTSNGTLISSYRNSGFTNGRLTGPTDVAYDSMGNLYVLDNGAYHARVQKFTNGGTYISTIIQPDTALDIASYHMVIKNDQIYISDYVGVKKFDLDGNLLMSFGSRGTGDGQFQDARGIGIDSNGNIYVSDLGNFRVQKFASDGTFITKWGSAGTAHGQFGGAASIVVDSNDNIYVAENENAPVYQNTRIQVFNTSGAWLRTISSFDTANGGSDGNVFRIGGMAFNADGNLEVSEQYYTKIQVFNPTTGAFLGKYGKSGSGVEEFSAPNGMNLNPLSGTVTIADNANHRVQLLPSGTRIYNLISSADVLKSGDNTSLVYNYFNPTAPGVNNLTSNLYFGDYVVSDFAVNLTSDRDWVNVNVLTLPNESKSLIVNLNPSEAPGVSAAHSLYIVRQEGQTSVHICPNATLLADIAMDCNGGYDLEEGAASLSSVTIGNMVYWKITGLTGTGAMSLPITTAQTPTPTPTPSPTATATVTATATATPTVTTTVTPIVTHTPIGTDTPSATGTPTVTPTPTVTVTLRAPTPTPKYTGTPIPVTTLSAVVKGTTPSCPQFTAFSASSTIIKKGETVLFKWTTKNTEVVTTALSQKDLNPIDEISFAPDITTVATFVADNGVCTAKKEVTIYVVETMPWTNTITVGTGALLVEAAIALQQPTLFGNLWLGFASLLNRKKKRSWGFIYDSTTKKPISRAIIRLIREDGTISDTVVSEANGSFRLTPKVGKFKISVTHQQYTFPSKAIKGDTDAGYTNIYLGETINITDVNNGLLLSIPLDPVNLSEADKQAIARKKMFDQAISLGSTLLMVGGLMYSIYVSVIYPHFYNYLVLAVYGLIIVVKLVVAFAPRKSQGKVMTDDGAPVAGVELGIFDNDFKNLLYRTFTSAEGTYSFVVPNMDYNLKIMDERYAILSGGEEVKGVAIEHINKNEKIRVITKDLVVVEN